MLLKSFLALSLSIALIAVSCPAQLTVEGTRLTKRNPNGWFTVLIPARFGKVLSKADVDGGIYMDDALSIDYSYWTYEGTPNFLRNVHGNFSRLPQLACTRKDRAVRTTIDRKRALVQSCSPGSRYGEKGFRYLYYVTFPGLRVSNGESFRPGNFNMTISYNSPRQRSIAETVVRSLNFSN